MPDPEVKQHDSDCLDFLCQSLFILMKGKSGRPPRRLGTEWIIECADAVSEKEIVDDNDDPFAGIRGMAELHGIDIPTVT